MVNRRTAAFTLSLDCEGLWGVADNPAFLSNGLICSASLSDAYGLIQSTLEHNCLKATAAFVACFAAAKDALLDQRDLVGAIAEHNPAWFKYILPALNAHQTEGWNGNYCYELMRGSGHEIAWHGTTHQPLLDTTAEKAVALELLLTSELFQQLGQRPGTVIFPRNQPGQLTTLMSYGFKTYREAQSASKDGPVAKLMTEFNVKDRGSSKLPRLNNNWCVSPAGHFLHWPWGIRSLVPVQITVLRWKSMIRHAVETGGYLHMWFHPHNLITAPAMVESFKCVINHVGEFVRSGDLVCLTIEEANDYYAVRPA